VGDGLGICVWFAEDAICFWLMWIGKRADPKLNRPRADATSPSVPHPVERVPHQHRKRINDDQMCNSRDQEYGAVVSLEHDRRPHGHITLRLVNGQSSSVRRARRAPWSPWVCVASIGVHFALRPLLDNWLNALSDRKLFAALAILAAPLLFAAYAFYRSIDGRPHR